MDSKLGGTIRRARQTDRLENLVWTDETSYLPSFTRYFNARCRNLPSSRFKKCSRPKNGKMGLRRFCPFLGGSPNRAPSPENSKAVARLSQSSSPIPEAASTLLVSESMTGDLEV